MYAKKNIGVIGAGFVGKHVIKFFSRLHEVHYYDTSMSACGTIQESAMFSPLEELSSWADFLFICVPSPMAKDGRCDVSIVDKVVSDLNKLQTQATIIIKSTVALGTTKRLCHTYPDLKIVFSPEFASMSKYWSPHGIDRDMVEAPYYIFGGEKYLCSKVIDLFIQVGGPTKKYLQTQNPTEAEMAKYITNTFYATKITFCNEMKSICDSYDLDWHTVRELWLSDPRVSPMHTAVFAQNLGYGSACFPKDTFSLIKMAEDKDVDAMVLKAVHEENKKFRAMNKKEEEK